MKGDFMKLYSLFLISLVFMACDPTYVIAIQNRSDDIIKLKAQINERFHTNNFDSILIDYQGDDWIEAEIKPNSQLDCGFAIAGLENNIPFNQIEIFIEDDTISAKNNKELLKLFDNRGLFTVMTPYILVID